MNNCRILDCTLREYFSYLPTLTPKEVNNLHAHIATTGIDYIECGHLRNKNLCETVLMQEDIRAFDDFIGSSNQKCLVIMDINRFDINKLPVYSNGIINCIRLCFKHSELSIVPQIANAIIEKGYDLFIQHVDYIGYCSDEIINFLLIVNNLNPVSYCVVDTFGHISVLDLDEIINTISKGINEGISLGFHGHNNIMMANALNICFAESTKLQNRMRIIDSSFLGLGRGAGNANTEIMLNHFKPETLESAIKCADYLVSFLHSEHYKRQFAYFITGIFDAHSFIADKLLAQGVNLFELFYALQHCKSSDLKGYNDVIISNLLSSISYLEEL